MVTTPLGMAYQLGEKLRLRLATGDTSSQRGEFFSNRLHRPQPSSYEYVERGTPKSTRNVRPGNFLGDPLAYALIRLSPALSPNRRRSYNIPCRKLTGTAWMCT
jgi:hypothetical protein